ncbi:MAG: hypothetical protein A2293_02595 [Elusimicrobia bacterium RIFOXYB2_FULL_49_7]|nr:MAG: hypothetical protein A2293_02595 [Elusimicrobia bacterium RIFOXYB2_FULL_49_7]
MSENREKFNHLLRRLYRIRMLFKGAEGVTAIFAFFLFHVLLLFNIVSPIGKNPVVSFAFLIFSLFSAFLLILVMVLFFRRLRAPMGRITRDLEKQSRAFGSSVTAAHELSDIKQEGISSYLVERHLVATLNHVRSGVDNATQRARKDFISKTVLLLPLLFAWAMVAALQPHLFREWRNWIHGPFIPSSAAGAVLPVVGPVPLLGDVSVTYGFPAYTRLASRTEKNRSGRLRCLKGTRVTLSGRCSQPVADVALVTASGIRLPVAIDSEKLSFTVDVMRTEGYRLLAKDKNGQAYTLLQDSLLCDADAPPQVALDNAPGPLVVRKRDVVTLDYRATDDFGLSRVHLIIGRDNKAVEEREKVAEPTTREYAGEARCDLALLNLKEGERGVILVEAVDNDGVSGRKSSRSAPVFFTVLDEGRDHAEVEAKLAVLIRQTLFLLADHLEKPLNPAQRFDIIRMVSGLYDAKAFDLIQRARETLLAMENDARTSDEVYDGIQDFIRNFGEAVEGRRKTVADNRSAMEAENREIVVLEDFLYFLDRAKDREKVDDLVSRLDDLLRDEQKLEERLAEQKEDEKIAALRDRLEALKKELADLFNEMMKNRKESSLPDEFLNSDALKHLPKDQLSEAMARLQAALDKGDAEQAMKEWLQLRELLEQMRSAVNSASGDFYDETGSQEMEKLRQASDALQKLIDRQTRLNSQGDQALQEMADALSDEDMKRLGKMANEQGAILERIKSLEASLQGGLDGMPGNSGQALKDGFQGCKSGLGSAFNRMSEYKLPMAMPSAKSGLYQMLRLKEGMEQAMGHLQQPCQSKPGMSCARNKTGRGRSGLKTGEVEIENKKEPENNLREMIKKAIKEKGPEEFENENKRYYEKLGN